MNAGMYAELTGDQRAAREARELVLLALGEDHPAADDATLIASELVSNAITHTRSGQPGGTVILAIETSAEAEDVCIRVRDAGGPDVPVVTDPGPGSEHGRGLSIIAALAAEWGSEASGAGRSTWCKLTRDPDPCAAAGSPSRRQHGEATASQTAASPGESPKMPPAQPQPPWMRESTARVRRACQ